MKDKLVTLAKEKGFISSNFVIGRGDIIIPDKYYYLWLAELQKWLREECELFINVYFDPIIHYHYCKIDRWNDEPIYVLNIDYGSSSPEFKSYEEALEKGAYSSLKLI